MTEWWTYVPADFQLFSARTYARLVEAHNRALWPAQALNLACGVVLWLALLRRVPWAARALAALAALWCIGVAWDFLQLRYAQIHWGAPTMAVGFALQALLLALIARRAAFAASPTPRQRAWALALLALALAGWPLLAPLAGASWWRAEVPGLMPAPTVLAVLALAPLATARARYGLLPLPLAWCAVEALTQAALGATAWPLLPLAGALALAGSVKGGRARTRRAQPLDPLAVRPEQP